MMKRLSVVVTGFAALGLPLSACGGGDDSASTGPAGSSNVPSSGASNGTSTLVVDDEELEVKSPGLCHLEPQEANAIFVQERPQSDRGHRVVVLEDRVQADHGHLGEELVYSLRLWESMAHAAGAQHLERFDQDYASPERSQGVRFTWPLCPQRQSSTAPMPARQIATYLCVSRGVTRP